MEDYISVSTASRICGVSRQAIYQRLDKDLNQYLKVGSDGTKLIHRDALQYIGSTNLTSIDEVEYVKHSKVYIELEDQCKALQQEVEDLNSQVSQLRQEVDNDERVMEGYLEHLQNIADHDESQQKLIDEYRKQIDTDRKEIESLHKLLEDQSAQTTMAMESLKANQLILASKMLPDVIQGKEQETENLTEETPQGKVKRFWNKIKSKFD